MGSPERKIMCLIAASILLSLPVYNGLTKQYLRDALLGNPVDCTGSIPPRNLEGFPYDAIVVPGAGMMGNPGQRMPSWESQNRLGVAARLFREGMASQVIITDGKPEIPLQPGDITSRDFLLSFLQETNYEQSTLNARIKDDDRETINTATNMEKLSMLNPGRILLVTSESHAPRATSLACAHGMAATEYRVEEPSGKSFTTLLKEKLEILLMFWDPQGRIPTKIKELMV